MTLYCSTVKVRVKHDLVTKQQQIIIRDNEHLFMCFLAICMSSLEKCLFRSSTHFLSFCCCCYCCYRPAWAICISWWLIFCQLFHLQMFLPFWRLSLLFPLLCKHNPFDLIRSYLFLSLFIILEARSKKIYLLINRSLWFIQRVFCLCLRVL